MNTNHNNMHYQPQQPQRQQDQHRTVPEINTVMNNVHNFRGTFNLNKSGFDANMPGHQTAHDMIFRQAPRTVKQAGSGISLPLETRLEMALMLDDHQCALSIALHQYNKPVNYISFLY